ncbi:MAG: hypothetical protein BWX51_01785 [Bacteroidetes bacterium ADurb.Bin012]|jgi:hypothetical protein|nr:MAG: hypothetical protein BWX51_01785 [Bacteroidetes bacterium ADurb.Bin012]
MKNVVVLLRKFCNNISDDEKITPFLIKKTSQANLLG